MTYEEYENLTKNTTAENFQTVMLDLLGNLKNDLTEKETIAADIASKDAKIKDLQDTNMKLFLSIGKATDDNVDPEDEETKLNETVENEISKILGGN